MGLTFRLGQIPLAIQTDTSNNVGIGGAANASYKLQVTGATNLTGALSGTSATFSSSVTVNGASATTSNIIFQSASSQYGYIGSGGGWEGNIYTDFAIAASSGKQLNIYTNGTTTPKMIVTTTGNVGIGISNPTNPLHIASNTVSQLNVAALSGNTNAQINLEPTGTGIALIGPASAFPLAFRTDATERMRITSGGITQLSGTNGAVRLEIRNTDNAGYMALTEQEIRMWRPNGSGADLNIATQAISGSLGSGSILFQPNNALAMSIKTSGDVLVGTTSDSFYNGSNAGIGLFGSNTFIAASRSSATCAFFNRFTTTGDIVQIRYAGSNVGSISYNGVNTLYNATSDYRLKEDLKDYNALNIINQLKTYDFKWKKAGIRDYGMMAHELQEVLPNYVNGDKDSIDENGKINPQGVDYSKIVPILVKAIQELNAKLN
jgi:hypothetical protein